MGITTTDFSKFGYRERVMAEKLLSAWNRDGLPDNFEDYNVEIMFNTHSGSVFLTNESYQVAMMNKGNLEIFYLCPYCGHEGFLDEMEHKPEDEECEAYMADIGVVIGMRGE
jgi:hypothetical protein